ncbi:MAG: hypothetical protein AMK70_08535 [Nitrospira bacterium SG8_35_1]|nr:MAG: hypothetical protein AMK70_08535 [Nitrospira bacterium SG8_35_1]
MYGRIISTFKNYPIILILMLASVLRFWGIWHDYPFSYYPDEEHFVKRALSFGSGDLNPHWFHKPAFLMYVLFIEYGLFFLIGKIIGVFPDVHAFAVYYFKNSGPFILIGRITVTLFGVLTVYATYRIGVRFWSKQAGLYASLLLALCYGHIFAGQDVKADVPTTFFTVLSVYYLLRICSYGFQTRDYVFAGLMAGLGTATKYYSIALLPCIFLVAFIEGLRNKNFRSLLKYIYAVISFWATYFIASPYNFLDPLGRRSTFRKIVQLWNKTTPWDLDIYSLQGEKSTKFLARNFEGNYITKSIANYFDVLLSKEGAGIVIGLIFLFASIFLVRHISLKKMVLLCFPIIFSVISITFNPSYTEPRHQVLIYPFLAVAAGISISETAGKLRRDLLVKILFALLLILPLSSIINNCILLSGNDTRTSAKNWIELNIPAGTKILVEESSIKISPDAGYFHALLERAEMFQKGQFTTHMDIALKYSLEALPDITYDITYIRFPWWQLKEKKAGTYYADDEYDKDMGNPLKPVGIETYDYYQREGFEYVVVSSTKYETFIRESNASARFPSFAKFYKDLFNNAILINEFVAGEFNSRGPTVKIFKISS